jgi:hypothetical protein
MTLSAVTIGEIRKGRTVLPPGRRRAELETWFHADVLTWFHDRILSVTHAVANRWGVLDGQCQLRATPLNTADGMMPPPLLNTVSRLSRGTSRTSLAWAWLSSILGKRSFWHSPA